MSSKTCSAVVASAVLAVAALLPKAASAQWGADYFPNVALTTQDGKVVHFYDDLLKGKKVAVNLIYTRCTSTCPLETAKLTQVKKLLGDRVGKDLFFISISIDPDHDTPQVLKAYSEKFHTGDGWTFVTGDENDIKLIAKKLGLSSITDAKNRDGHQPALMIGDVDHANWMRNSAVDNPQFLASTITNFFGFKKSNVKMVGYAEGVAKFKQPDQGEYMFQTRCAACHTIGKGDSVGPDLAGLTSRREKPWVARYLHEPELMLAEKDPIAVELYNKYQQVRMPNLGLSHDEIAALLGQIEKLSPPTQKTARNLAMP